MCVHFKANFLMDLTPGTFGNLFQMENLSKNISHSLQTVIKQPFRPPATHANEGASYRIASHLLSDSTT